MIESFKKSIIFFTNHDSALNIAKQTSLVISSTDRLNLRLIRAFEYIQRFNVIIKHKPEKHHIVPDALSRLASENDEHASNSKELDVLTITDIAFITTLIKMNPKFKFKIISEYFEDLK
jgi:hypothetical protein